jgi:uncharacterized protein (TIGR04141 family)
MPKTNTFSLYLAKPEVSDFDELLTEAAHSQIENRNATKSTSTEFGDDAALYTFPGFRNIPKWVEQLKRTFLFPDNLFTQSPCAILAFKKGKSIFALTFSFAHVYLNDLQTETDFGLKVAINSIGDDKLRSVERSNIGASIRDFAQAARQRDLRSFGFDDALDLIRKVTGYAEDNEFADKITGSRALRFSKKIDIAAVPDAAIEALSLFRSEAYKETSFKIIDFLSPVSDRDVQSRLDNALLVAIRVGSDEFEIAIPEILPESVGSFRFEHAGFTEFHPDLSLELYRAGLKERLDQLTLEDIKKHTVAAYSENENRPLQYWSVHRSLVGSLILNGERYALNEGFWYRVDQKFKEAADNEFLRLCGEPDKKLRPLKKIYRAGGKKRNQKPVYQSEQSYNEEIAKDTGFFLLDRQLIQISDVPGPGIEACDLLDIEGHRFIHVKKSSRQSSVLSHFFKQGGNAAQMMRKYESFRTGMIDTIKNLYGAETALALETALNARWTVDFQIADFPREDGNHNIPFFSKLTLRDEARTIEAMGFDVRLGFITLARV